MNKPHKHAELIKAWADGAEIECRADASDLWEAVQNPRWVDLIEYRIKPEEKKPVVRWLWATKDGFISRKLITDDEATLLDPNSIKLEWSRTEFPE